MARVRHSWKPAIPVIAGLAIIIGAQAGNGTPGAAGVEAGLVGARLAAPDSTAPQADPEPDPLAGAVTVLAAGDIASCDSHGDEGSAALLADYPGSTILTLGDQAYPDGTAANYRDCFDPGWGKYRDRIRPVPGNHEYYSSNADAYFAYFGAAAGPADNTASRGYYSFDVGAWHVVALNSEQDIAPDGAQLAWLRADLRANQRQCVLAIWHRPLFTAGSEYPSGFSEVTPFWDALQQAGAEIVLNGHDHSYQRYGPMDAGGHSDPNGIREFVVGTGGRAGHELLLDPRRDAEHSAAGFSGVLRLRLGQNGYEWTFLSAGGDPYMDSGTGTCH